MRAGHRGGSHATRDAYRHNGAWWAARSIVCLSGAWTSANGDSAQAAIRGLLEAHTVRITVERVNGASTTVLASEEVSNLGTPRNTQPGVLYGDIAFSYGIQPIPPGEAFTGPAGLPDQTVAGQGAFIYEMTGRTFEIAYNLTATDVATRMRCVAGADDGPVAHPTSGSLSTDFTVPNNPLCAPQQVAPGNAPQPLFAILPPATCVVATGQLQLQGVTLGVAPVATVSVTSGTAAIPITCAVPGGCHGTLSLVSTTAASSATAASHAGQILGRLRISLARGADRFLPVRLTPRGRRLLNAAKNRSLPAVLRLTSHGHTRTLATLRLLRKRT